MLAPLLFKRVWRNKVVNGTQMMVRWHVDDLMISYISQHEILEFVRHIKDIYGDNLAKNVGMTHDYLGRTFNYAFEGEVWINMCKYLSKVIEDFPEEIMGVSTTPAADYLFKVREDAKKLNEEQADIPSYSISTAICSK